MDLQILMPAHNEESNIKEILYSINKTIKKMKINTNNVVYFIIL